MAYNNGYPVTYPQMYYPQAAQIGPNFNASGLSMPTPGNSPMQQPQAVSGAQSGIIWVQGEAGAKSYLVAPNTTVQLWDSEDQKIYLKSADASGLPSIRTLEYTIKESGNGSPMRAEAPYAMQKDVDDLRKQIEALRTQITKEAGNESVV